MPELYIIAGPNGAGKTTTAYALLPDVLYVLPFVNADEIARGLSPFQPESVALEAGRIMLQRIDALINKQADFAFETTLSTRSYVSLIKRAKEVGYTVTLLFIYLPSSEMAIQRVAERVAAGGHHIPDDVVRRRYSRAISNFFNLYVPICDSFLMIDNSEQAPVMVALGEVAGETILGDSALWTKLRLEYGQE